MAEESKSFWSTLPGVLTGLAALITAITGAVIYFKPPPPNNPYQKQAEVQPPDTKPTEPSPMIIVPKPITKIEGEWKFEFHSTASGVTFTGKLSIQSDVTKGENGFKGNMATDSQTDWNHFSSNISGTFENNKIAFTRETSVKNVLQAFELVYVSANKNEGIFHNEGDLSPAYKDAGTIKIQR